MLKKFLATGLAAGVLTSLALSTGAAFAAEWPTQKPIRLISVFPPGGSVDQVARVLAPALQAGLKQTVVVENVAGASGMIGTAAVAKADPDGYTFGVVFDTHAVNPALKEKMAFDTRNDLVTITLVGTSPMVLAAAKNAGITSFSQLIEASKAKKPQTFGSIGTGSLGHLAMASLAQKAGYDWTHVPYKGGGPLMQDAIGGHVPLSVGSLFLVKPHADAGNVIPLAVTTTKRSKDMPNVPTIAESGFPGFEAPAWWAVIAPAKTPPAIIARVHQEIAAALKSPAIAKRLDEQGIDIIGGDPAYAKDFVEKQMGIWGKFVTDNKIKD
ncbi:MAG: tripartite tricarboxylate transporter substrate binding protein [Limnobacter sp.]|nr:tripartite tricarboxylate transporter substrate binding protein [Limnobacter sp.]